MRSFLPLFILFAIGFNVLRAEFGIATFVYAERVYTPAFPCIAQNFGRAVFRLDGYQNFVDDYIGLRDANFTGEIDAYIDLQKEQSDAETFCLTIARSVPNTFSGIVWIEPQINNITNVEEIVQACQDQNLTMGIYSNIDEWIENFGHLSVSSPILSVLPLWYLSQINTTDFDDFPYSSFGGWNTSVMKTLSGAGVPCNNWVDFSNGYSLTYYETNQTVSV